jgi:signal peptide peptidase SppA
LPPTIDISRSAVAPLTLAASLVVVDPFWAIEPAWWENFLSQRGAETAPHAGWFDDDDTDESDPPYSIDNGVAILEMSGPMSKRSYWWGSGSGSTSQFRRTLQQAVDDSRVQSILLKIDSPGGQVAGTADLALDIAAASQRKPIAAFLEDSGCSAAYWIASQAGAGVYCNQTAMVGSVGTLFTIDDTSGYFKQLGIKRNVLGTGKWKGAGTSGAPITDEQRAYFEDQAHAINASFLASVQVARGLSDSQMETVREAGVFIGQQAVDMGLVDEVTTLAAVLQKLRQKSPGTPNGTSVKRRAYTENAALALARTPAASSSGSEERIPGLGAALDAARTRREADLAVQSASGAATTADPVPLPPQPAATPQTITPPAHSAAGREGPGMKEQLIRLLSALKLNKMAVALVATTGDSPESLAQAMAEQVQAEADERVRNHPLMLACEGAGITDVVTLQSMLAMKTLGEQHLGELRTDAKAQAIRAFGVEVGPKIAAGIDHLPAAEARTMRDSWSAQADATFGIGENGAASGRVSAAKPVLNALSAEGDPAANTEKTGWEQLTPEQRKTGLQLGMKTPALQETFARQYLNAKAAV